MALFGQGAPHATASTHSGIVRTVACRMCAGRTNLFEQDPRQVSLMLTTYRDMTTKTAASVRLQLQSWLWAAGLDDLVNIECASELRQICARQLRFG